MMPPPIRSEAEADAATGAEDKEDEEEEEEEDGGDKTGFVPRFTAVKRQPMWLRHCSQNATVQAYPGNHECCMRPKERPASQWGRRWGQGRG